MSDEEATAIFNKLSGEDPCPQTDAYCSYDDGKAKRITLFNTKLAIIMLFGKKLSKVLCWSSTWECACIECNCYRRRWLKCWYLFPVASVI
jgi:hypothetical protein